MTEWVFGDVELHFTNWYLIFITAGLFSLIAKGVVFNTELWLKHRTGNLVMSTMLYTVIHIAVDILIILTMWVLVVMQMQIPLFWD